MAYGLKASSCHPLREYKEHPMGNPTPTLLSQLTHLLSCWYVKIDPIHQINNETTRAKQVEYFSYLNVN